MFLIVSPSTLTDVVDVPMSTFLTLHSFFLFFPFFFFFSFSFQSLIFVFLSFSFFLSFFFSFKTFFLSFFLPLSGGRARWCGSKSRYCFGFVSSAMTAAGVPCSINHSLRASGDSQAHWLNALTYCTYLLYLLYLPTMREAQTPHSPKRFRGRQGDSLIT